ncbi:glycerol transporter [Yamadazyma tenuis]|uniref:MBOAT-domain-containing protein n=1 Tax=Candida tenuis (strain ATCC 10573 / BCRC 21748 / CBS 615 / JCM 9827 / NBRC 10315 / NRRL Y-1498 / VKM Y-70) TaxID=590646 RepID=G3B7K9_CANTC|nr:uncharacterized protein CANTEDRAFT_124579 [Yamadazyma tenuis ATCC 10573]EGV61641.1 hypothetical protein CANTEDRAFT_124579 [Yamadazyma tenuis ATCC 10573]WEJ92863.1 glycerol transporter [Yamadazyma tenuis]
MKVLDDILSFFALETLDTRLFPPSDLVKRESIKKKVNPKSRWGTLEFKIYLLVFAVFVPLLYKTAMDASNETNPNYPRYERLLSPGWMFGRKVDNSDSQYRFFRDNFPLLVGLIVIHVTLRRVVSPLLGLTKRTQFDFGFGLVFLFGAHGFNVFKVFIHLGINYAIGKYIKSHKVAYYATWIYGISSLFLNDRYRSFKFGVNFVDYGFKGIIERWDVFYNFTLLRMLSFNLDYLERKQALYDSKKEIKEDKLVGLDDRQRLSAPFDIGEYSLFNYVAYLTYTPLFIAGPILTFNDYLYQSNYETLASVKNHKRTFVYGVRFLFCVLVMEFLLHFIYVVAVSKAKAWTGDTPFQISMIGLFNLNIIWLKLLIPWRMFRLWALIDGIDPPENMIRCMDNNYSALAFWRAWHRSFNRFIVRYIYVPMGGGGQNRILNSLLVFSFVAIWHDIELKLLLWGWLVVLFLLPEITATLYFQKYSGKWWFRYLCSVGAVLNIWMMMIANLFGFCLGKDGTTLLLREIFETFDGIKFFVVSSAVLFAATQVMFEMRNSERRKGIDVRC